MLGRKWIIKRGACVTKSSTTTWQLSSAGCHVSDVTIKVTEVTPRSLLGYTIGDFNIIRITCIVPAIILAAISRFTFLNMQHYFPLYVIQVMSSAEMILRYHSKHRKNYTKQLSSFNANIYDVIQRLYCRRFWRHWEASSTVSSTAWIEPASFGLRVRKAHRSSGIVFLIMPPAPCESTRVDDREDIVDLCLSCD